MYLLDADTATLSFREHPQVSTRISQTAPSIVRLSAIAAEEMLQGTLARINRERSQLRPDVETASLYFVRLLTFVSGLPILPYTNEAERLFRSWPSSVKRVGPNDCRIAASAIVHGYTVVTCNAKDYSRIPGVTFADWSI